MALRRSRPTRLTLVLLVLLSVTAVTLDVGGGAGGPVRAVRSTATDALAPVRAAVAAVVDPVGDAVQGMAGYGHLEEENAELRARVAELEARPLQRDAAAGELAELKAALALDDVHAEGSVAARVVGIPVSNLAQTVELDRGSEHGVAVDLPVVNGAGLVGRVVEVARRRSTVRLVTDTGSAVAVRLPTGHTAVAEGRGAGEPLAVDLVAADTPVEVGQVVVTSGLEGTGLSSYFPGGLVLGEVVESRPEAGEQRRHVAVEPAADLDDLVFVRVVRAGPAP